MEKIIETLSLKNKRTLCLDLGDTYITIENRGTFNGKRQFSWSALAPTEGMECFYDSTLIGETGLKTRIELLSGGKISDMQKHAIDLFLASRS